jgi:hypothetical protein
MANPAEDRTFLQTTYDRYMGGESLRLGLRPDMSQFVTNDLDARDARIAEFAARFPARTEDLVGRIVHEACFYEASRLNHAIGVDRVLDRMTGMLGTTTVAYVSGIGRNGVGVSLATSRGVRTVLAAPERARDIVAVVDVAGIIMDPDFGMGNFHNDHLPTPRATITDVPPAEGGWLTVFGQ